MILCVNVMFTSPFLFFLFFLFGYSNRFRVRALWATLTDFESPRGSRLRSRVGCDLVTVIVIIQMLPFIIIMIIIVTVIILILKVLLPWLFEVPLPYHTADHLEVIFLRGDLFVCPLRGLDRGPGVPFF